MNQCRKRCVLTSLLILASLYVAAFGQNIVLPRVVPAFNQAYTDGPEAWGNCQLGTSGCPDEVCTTGCLITAFSSVLAYYDIIVSVSAAYSCTGQARTGMDPGIFNDWLQQTGGYGQCAQDPAGNCCLIWGQLPDGLEITTHVNRSDVGLNPVSAVVIDHALRQGHLVVAGVHWGAFCNGSASQSEDCHWVILTGKQDGVYTIVDPYNPDPASPYGVRTTLDAGVHGSYIIDRFVVVTSSPPGDVTLEIKTSSVNGTVPVGSRIVLTMTTPDSSSEFVPYARLTNPSGQILYATLDQPNSRSPRFVADRQSLVSAPRTLHSEWTWFNQVTTASEIGRWTWEIWIERPDEPGTKLGRQTIAYDVASAQPVSSVGAAIVGVLLVAAVAIIAFVSVLQSGLK